VRVTCGISAFLVVLLVSGCGKSPPAAPSTSTKTVIGQVVSSGGRPITDANVVVDTDWSGESFVKLRTDPEGKFSFDVEVPTREPHRHGVLGRASVSAPGYGVGGGLLHDAHNVICLSRATEVSGTVQDEFGRPLPDALVELRLVEDSRGFLVWLDMLEIDLTARSGADGNWSISSVPTDGGSAYIRLIDPRFVRVQCEVPIGGGNTAKGVLVARVGGSIVGRVVYENGTPAEHVSVFAQPRSEYGGLEPLDCWTETSADGSYVLPGLTQAGYNVMVGTPPDGWVAAALEAVDVAPPQKTPAHDLVLTRGAVVQGRVIDGRTGAPLPRVRVGGHGPSRPRSSGGIFAANTDAKGRYTLRLPPGESVLSAETGQPELESGAHAVTLRSGETRIVDFVLWPPREKGSGWWPF